MAHATQVVQNQISSQLRSLAQKCCVSFALFVVLEDGSHLTVSSDDLDALDEWIKADQTLGAVTSRYQLDKALQLQLSAQKRGWNDLPDAAGLPNRLVKRLMTAGEEPAAAAHLCTAQRCSLLRLAVLLVTQPPHALLLQSCLGTRRTCLWSAALVMRPH
jgi:hypothetical protein